MIKLYHSIFSVSYYSLKKYYSVSKIEEWDAERKKVNVKINQLILNFLSNRINKNRTKDQFFLDYINYFICQHISSRNKFYSYGISKSRFIFYSFIDKYLFTCRLIVSNLKNFLTGYKLGDISKLEDCTICIGFPEHAFNYSKDYLSNPSSFVEFSLSNKIFNQDENILSFDEYRRLSYDKSGYKDPKNYKPDSFNRKIIKKQINFFKIITIWPKVFYLYLKSIQINKTFSISIFSYFMRNNEISIRFFELYKKLKNFNIKINNIIFLHTHYIYGSVFRDFNQELIKTFNYSQNYQIPTSKIIPDWISQNLNSSKINAKLIIEELYTRFLSEYYRNPINFSHHGRFFSKIRGVLNKKYNLNLIDSKSKDEINNKYYPEDIYSNLGYENIESLNLEFKNTILFCDNSIESREQNISRDFFGDFIALEEFMFDFYKEIIYVAKSYNYELYYKGKYWQDKEKSNILDKVAHSLNYEVKKIDPYSKLIFSNNKKFDCVINYPFTSTYFTLNNSGEKNFFFVPTKYIKSFSNDTKDICLGRNNLQLILKK